MFGVGLLGSALIAIPVLAGTSAYVMSGAFHWRGSLDAQFEKARSFYGTLIASLVVGALIALIGVAPIKLLFISGIAGGIATPFTLALLMMIARDRKVMKQEHQIGAGLAVAGWGVTAVVFAASVIYLYRTATGGGS